MLQPEFEIVGTVSDGRQLILLAPQLNPDVVLIDVSMPLLNGLDAGEQLKKLLPRAKLIVLTMNEDAEMAAEVMRSWASGYLLKKSAGSELVRAIREVLKGGSYVTPQIARQQHEQFVRDPRPGAPKALTSRQREVLQLLAEGRTMKEAAGVLGVTTRTIAFHKYRIMDAFAVKSNSDLVMLAIRERLITPPLTGTF
jgi:DNA-binding NarL/FixJ family response regulator